MASLSEALGESSVRALASGYWPSARDQAMVVEIARIESAFVPTAHALDSDDDSYGLMQINMKGQLGVDRLVRHHLGSKIELFNPFTNMRVAHEIWEMNGNSFGGSAGWSTSAATAESILAGTGGHSPTPLADNTVDMAAVASARAKLGVSANASLDELEAAYYDDANSAAAESLTQAEAGALIAYISQERARRATSGLGTTGSNLVDNNSWLGTLGALLAKLLDPTFWKRIGIGVLGAVVIIIAIAFWNKDAITEAVKPL